MFDRRSTGAGALALEHFEANRESEFGRIMFRLLDEYVVRPHDRGLFDFLPQTDPLDPPATPEFPISQEYFTVPPTSTNIHTAHRA